jgi:uncharacterized protein
MPNRLAEERSPYLLQHANNPVDWLPWGTEAFERAGREDKPIFLSIGYSTCHWCHVMEHESFENQEVAAALNRDFISIKVDREERPDVDRVYMTFVQATTGSGGWPMSVWLTPGLKPFFGGTYFPPSTRWNRPGFLQVLDEIARLWRSDRARVIASADDLIARLRSVGPAAGGADVPGTDALARGLAQFRMAFDARRGGFGDAPKFPRPSELLFLLREHARTDDESAREMALVTLRAMALGGMRDHVGGGFHRYSVDGDWRVPHFEKMLYDQAQLVLAYLEAAQVSGDDFFTLVAEDTLQYVAREMTDPPGGFYSAEDADSVPPDEAEVPGAHKTEGAFYLWRADEIRQLLGADAEIYALRFGIEAAGNAPFDPQNEFTGKNLLYAARPLEEVAAQTGRSVEDVAEALERARLVLFKVRLRRPHPHLDDKVLTAWNGLMIAAFARAARIVGDRRHLESARRAARFLLDTMWDETRQILRRRYRAGEAAIDGYAEDYAYAIFGLIELFQADGDPVWLDWARKLQSRQDELFWDAAEGGWFGTTGDDPSVLMRLKEDYDGAEPAASSVGVLNLLSLSHLRPDAGQNERVRRTLSLFAPRLGEYGRAVPMMMAALSTWHAGLSQIVIVGDPHAEDTAALQSVLRSRYLPFALTVPVDVSAQAPVAERLEFLAGMRAIDGRATAYVCRNFACQAPANAPEALERTLEAGIRG